MMVSFDTNLAVYAMNTASEFHGAALQFMTSLAKRKDEKGSVPHIHILKKVSALPKRHSRTE
jgi:hypothetical protein